VHIAVWMNLKRAVHWAERTADTECAAAGVRELSWRIRIRVNTYSGVSLYELRGVFESGQG